MVARILLKQAAKLMNKIHPRLRNAFEKREFPRFDELVAIFTKSSIEFARTTSNIFVMFDALDECEKQHFGQIIQLIQDLNKSGIRVYATARPHCEAFIDIQTEPYQIEADVEDVKRYLEQELQRRKTDVSDFEFRREIVDKIADGVDGM
jgi:hypothetical protein